MFGNSISILYSALLADQKALQIRDRNVANVNNPDYAVENPYTETLPGVGGVIVTDIKRASDEILHQQLLNTNTRYAGYEELKNLLGSVEPYFSETDSGGLLNINDSFFQSLQDFLREPTNEAAQNALYSAAERLVDAIHERYNVLQNTEEKILDQFEESVNQVNRLVEELGKLNKEIAREYAQNAPNGGDYKYLLDQRDKLLKELSQYVNISYKTDQIGRVEVSIYEPSSTASGFIKLVDYNGEYNTFGFVRNISSPLQSKVVDNNGIQWNISFFKSGQLGGYSEAISIFEEMKTKLDTYAGDLINNLSLAGLGNKNLFSGTGAGDIAVNFTTADLQNYDTSQAQTDSDTADNVWNLAKDDLQDLNAYYSDNLTDAQIKYETEGDIYNSLKDKYAQKVGVNLDEELAEIMKLQQHYQALSKMIATSTKLLDYILNAVG